MTDIESNMLHQGLIKVPLAQENGENSTYRKIAKFLFIIGSEQAAGVLKHLNKNQIDRVIAELVTIRSVEQDEAEKIVNEFTYLYEKNKNSIGGVGAAKAILSKAFGNKRMQEIIERTIPQTLSQPFEYLEGIDSEKLSAILKNELPSTKAVVLSQLPAKQAADFISTLKDTEEKKQIILHLAKMKKVAPDILQNISETLHKKALSVRLDPTEAIDGKTTLAGILKVMDYKYGADILNSISAINPDLAEEIKDKIFTLDDIVNIPDISLRHFLAGVDNIFLTKLIYHKNINIRKKILTNISKNRAKEILTEEKFLTPLTISEQDAVSKDFLRRLLKAEKQGIIVLPRSENDVLV